MVLTGGGSADPTAGVTVTGGSAESGRRHRSGTATNNADTEESNAARRMRRGSLPNFKGKPPLSKANLGSNE